MTTVVVPWRPQPSRVPAFEAVVQWYRANLPSARIRPIDSDDVIFNLSKCRNLGIAGIVDPREVVIINDADTIPEIEPLLAAIGAAGDSQSVYLPYTEYRWLGDAGTAQHADGRDLEDCEFELVRGACSGVYVTTPTTWRSHGGQDERFRGWGFEDAAWLLAHETLLGEPPRRIPGRVFALHHQAELRVGPQYDANARLMQRYRDAAVHADAMRELVFTRVVP